MRSLSMFIVVTLALCAAVVPVPGATPAAPQVAGYELALVDMRGKRRVLDTLPSSVFAPRVSPDGRQVVLEIADAGPEGAPMRLWVAELARVAERRALPLVGTTRNWAAVWTQDGEQLVFQVSGDRPDTLFRRRADGSGEAEQLVEGRAPEGVFAGNTRLAFITLTGNRDYGIAALDLATRQVTPLVDRPGSEQHSSRVSPDGRWIAYASTETGRQEVWIEPLPQTGARYRITQNGGRHPLWSPDAKYLYFDQDDRMYRVEVFLASNPPKAGKPRALPIRGFQQGDLRRQFDLLPDGRHFLMLFPVSDR